MLFLISPAKALDYETPAHVATHTQPLFLKQASELVGVMREKSPQQIAELMDLSDALAGLNAARYQAWRPRFTPKNAKQAVLVAWMQRACPRPTWTGCNSTCAS
jgi:uncharacterized protein